MNPVLIVGKTFVHAAQHGWHTARSNSGVMLTVLVMLIAAAWLSLNFHAVFALRLPAKALQFAMQLVALLPELLLVVFAGLLAKRAGMAAESKFLWRWVAASIALIVGIALVEAAYVWFAEANAEAGPRVQGVMYIARIYALAFVFWLGLWRLAQISAGPVGFAASLGIFAAGLALYLIVVPTSNQLLLATPPVGYFWVTLNRLEAPYFFLTEGARILVQTIAVIVYASFFVVLREMTGRGDATPGD